MATAAELLVRIDATTEQLRREMRRADQTVATTARRTQRHLASMDSKFNAFARSLKGGLAGLGLVVGGGALVRGFDQLLQSMENIADRANQLGLTAEALQELRFAAEQNGATARQMDDAWQRLNRRLGLAAQDAGPAVRAFEDLEIAVRDADDQVRGTEDVFADVVRQLQRVEAQSQRAALASEIFGEDSGPKLVQLLDQGIDSINEFRQAAREMGVVIDEDTVQATARLNREWRVFVDQVSVQTQSAILGIVGKLKEWREAIEDLRAERDRADLTLLPQTDDVAELEQRVEAIRERLNILNPTGAPRTQLGFAAGVEVAQLELALGAVEARIAMLKRDAEEVTRTAEEDLPPLTLSSRTATTTAARAEEIDRVAEFIRRLREQNNLLGMEARERAQVEAVMRAQAIAMAEGNLLTTEQIEQIRELTAAQFDFAAAEREAAEAARETDRVARELGLTFTSAFEDAVVAGEELSDVLEGLAKDLARLAARRLVTEPLLGLVSGFLTGKQTGGAVAAGTALRVGEGGPELFIPRVPGTIVPAGRTALLERQAAAGGNTVILQVDATGADAAAVQRLEAVLAEFQRTEERRVLAFVQNAQLRGGAFAGAFR